MVTIWVRVRVSVWVVINVLRFGVKVGFLSGFDFGLE